MKIIKIIFSRLVIVGFILLLQLVWIITLMLELGQYKNTIHYTFLVISIMVVIWLINKRDNPAYKLAWVIPILIFPTLGGMLYLLYGNKKPTKGLRSKMEKACFISNIYLKQDPLISTEIKNLDPHVSRQSTYINNIATFPVHKNTVCEYFKVGEDNYAALIKELKEAKHFIFMEYFIVEEGEMWDTIREILVQKSKEGVEVRFIYDDVGCIALLPYQYYKQLEKMGIKCRSFNHFVPIFSLAMNNRDHRKITVIDGHIAFTGGINLADEYINLKKRFGHWKDTGVMIKGDAAWNFTIMFLQMWNTISETDDDYSKYMPRTYHTEEFKTDGFVQPYGDSPLDEEIVGENVYLNIINGAKEYVYLFTPYLIIDNEMMTALCLAAKKGVDVRIVTPGIPDKKYIYLLTQSYYEQLVDAGVRIFQYTPGFIHAKCFVCDDEIATVGTINMDYRSLYLHFECGVWMYKSKAVMDVKKDVLDTIALSEEITKEFCKRNVVIAILQSILRVFAPLM